MSDAEPSRQPESRDAKRWEIPAIDDSTGAGGHLTAGRLQELQEQAWNEAYQEGQSAGIKAGQQDVQDRAARFEELLAALTKPFDLLDEVVEKQLVELAMTVVRQLFRRELRIDPSHVIGVVRDAIKLLPVASRCIQVHLHPEDATLVQNSLPSGEGERAWSIAEDPLISRGGCRVTTENSQIDAQAETRLKAIINAIGGDERKQ